MSDAQLSSNGRTLPFSNAESFSDWLIGGLDNFYKPMPETGRGDDTAFPGYTFFVGEDILPQFPGFYRDLDDEHKSIVRQGLAFALESQRERLLQSPITLQEVVAIGLKIDRTAIGPLVPAYFSSLRAQIAEVPKTDERDIPGDTYTDLLFNLLTTAEREINLRPALEQEYHSTQENPALKTNPAFAGTRNTLGRKLRTWGYKV